MTGQAQLQAAPTYDVFLSYNRADEQSVSQVRTLLESRAIRTFYDAHNLAAGLPWPQALEQALSATRSVAVFIGARGLGLWQRREMYFALDLQVTRSKDGRAIFPVIPVLLNGAAVEPGFLFLNTWVDLRAGVADTDAVDRLVRSISGTMGVEIQRQPAGICPYVGLRAFREEDAAFYAGRTAFVEKLVAKVADRCPVIGVLGPSGSGKSSVIMAGLIPELRKGRPPHPTWDILVFKPGKYPWRSLADALVQLRDPDLASEEQSARAAKLVESLKSGNGAADSEFARTLSDSRGTDRLLVVIDQFEEWMIYAPTPMPNESEEQRKAREEKSNQRKQLLEDLFEVTALCPVTLVVTLRADYYSQAISYSRTLSDALSSGPVNLGPMTEAEVRAAIEEPAKRVGLAFEPGLVDRILKDVTDEPGSLPLLEYVLTAMWSIDSQTITRASYEKAGGVAGSISEAADKIYVGLVSKDEQEACRQLFTRLVHVTAAGAEGADTRQVLKRSQLREIHWEIAQRFADPGVRLLVMGRDGAEDTVEVAHEQLIRSWPRLRTWVNEDRGFLLWRAQLGGFIETWRKLGSGSNGLLQGGELRTAQQWLRHKPRDLNGEERSFILKGSKRKRISRAAVALIGVALLSAGVWAGYWRTDYAQIRATIRDAQRGFAAN